MEESWEFLRQLTREILDGGEVLTPGEKVIDFLHPEQLEERLDLNVSKEGSSREELLEACRTVIRYSLKTCHPMFLSRLYKGVDGYGLGGAWLTEALNTTQTTYEVGPAFTLVEKSVIQQLRTEAVGWDKGDGLFCPGGSLANMFAMALARHRACPEVKSRGMRAFQPLVCYASDQGHYSTKKGASFMGFGTDNVHIIPTDDRGRMIPEELDLAMRQDIEQVSYLSYFSLVYVTTVYLQLSTTCSEKYNSIQIFYNSYVVYIKTVAQGKQPLMVCATSGTTVLGAYDPLEPVGRVCRAHGVWLHVDAAWGGSVLLSRRHRGLMAGLAEYADSVAWNLHKMASSPLQCSLLLCRHETILVVQGLLFKCNANNAEYLFQEDKYYDTQYDTGDESIQCGRKVDAFKLWLGLKAHGMGGMEVLVDKAFETSRYLLKLVQTTEGFRPVLPEFECTNICFWYIPPSLRGLPEDDHFWNKMSKVAPEIKRRLVMEGRMLIDYHPITSKSMVNCFRVPLHCIPVPSAKDMDFLVAEIARVASDL
ncbi:hypothetical protein LAZ67_20001842 [Cordylochernes scorpioides]|uniref:Cysteine sulfinic acid decarboxylase n=1 Tax=Cordylochernes scorpioides TaxID=51811 RepID=A0ABY6LMV7_9ARAC|nr:hypothetical protein LAZ67_20001842 [Cordylochernes scorpioides]